MKTRFDEELEFAKCLALQAGEIMHKYFRSPDIDTLEKSDKTLVTLADIEINTLIIEKIAETYPEHSVWGEEEKVLIEGSKFTWVCDPVDGTVPFAKGLPISTFSLALVDSEGVSVVGVAYDPYQNRMYEAVRGNGAFVNGEVIHVSGKGSLERAFIDNEMWLNHEEKVEFIDPRDLFGKEGSTVTSMCSAVITGCLVAEGDYDAMIFGQGKPEDIAALSVIVEEAGGRVTDLFGNSQRYDRNILGAVVSNGKIHDEVVAIAKKTNYSSKYMK